MTLFSELGLSEPTCHALTGAGFTTPTPVQFQAIPHVIAGRDVLGLAQTGTGKTAAFALPLIERLRTSGVGNARGPRVLVLAPTRELAVQIGADFDRFGRPNGIRHTVVVGGVAIRPQIRAVAPTGRAGRDSWPPAGPVAAEAPALAARLPRRSR